MSKKNDLFKLPLIDGKIKQEYTNNDDNYNFICGKRTKPEGIIEELKKKIEEQRKEIDYKTQTIIQLQKGMEQLSNLLKSGKSEINSLKIQLSKVSEEFTILKSQKEEYQQKHQVLFEQQQQVKNEAEVVKFQRAEFDDMKELLNKKDGEIKNQQATIQELNKTVNNCQIENQQLKYKLDSLKEVQAKLASMENEIANLTQEVRHHDEDKQKVLELMVQQKNQLQQINEQREKIQAELIQYKTTKANYNQQEREQLYEISIKLHEILALRTQIKKLDFDYDTLQTLQKLSKIQEESTKMEATEMKNAVNSQIGLIKKLFLVFLDKESALDKCVCQKYTSLISKYESMKENCRDEILLVPKFEMESNQKTLQQMKENLKLVTAELDKKQQSIDTKVMQYQQTISQQEQKIDEVQGLLKLQIEENKLLQQSMEQQNNKSLLEQSSIKDVLQKKDMLIQAAKDETFRHANKIQELKEENQQMMEAIAAHNEQYSKLEKEKQDYFFQLDDLKKKNQGNNEQINEMNQQIQYLKERLKTEISNSEQLNAQLKRIMDIFKENEEQLNLKQTEFFKARQQFNDQIAENSIQFKTLSQSIEDKNYELNKILTLSEEQKDKIIVLTKAVEQFQSQIEQLKKTERQKDNEISIKDSQLKITSDLIQKLENTIKELNPDLVKEQQRKIEVNKQILESNIYKIKNAFDATLSHLHCDLCLELLKDSQTCVPCGHNYCQNCKKGYENQCRECRKAQNNYQYFPNKTLDGILQKVKFVQITLENIEKLK